MQANRKRIKTSYRFDNNLITALLLLNIVFLGGDIIADWQQGGDVRHILFEGIAGTFSAVSLAVFRRRYVKARHPD